MILVICYMNILRNKELVFSSHTKIIYGVIHKAYYIATTDTRMKISSDTWDISIKTFTKISIIVLHFQKHSNKNICCALTTSCTKSSRKVYIHYVTVLIDFSSFLSGHNLQTANSNFITGIPNSYNKVSFINLK